MEGDWLEDWLPEDYIADKEETDFLAGLKEKTEAVLPDYPVDTHIHFQVSRDRMKVWGCLMPPIQGGREELTMEEALAPLTELGVVYGIDEEELSRAIGEKRWQKLFLAARGKEAQRGQDGEVIEKFQRNREIRVASDQEGKAVDYRDLNWLQRVQAGQVICEIQKPTPPEEGMTVLGETIAAKPGNMPKIPMGENTKLNEEETALIAACDGQISYKNGLFCVDKVVQIRGDVDFNVGNLDVIGDVMISGNVVDGFTIKATGNIVVRGLVEGAVLESGGNIQISVGMKGSGKGSLKAKGEVRSRYLESCTVRAGGSVFADSIIGSEVYSSEKVVVMSGHGTILNSQINGAKGIEAKIIGKESSNQQCRLVAGADPCLTQEIDCLRKSQKTLKNTIEENEKNIAYLERAGKLEPPYQQLLSELKLRQTVDKMRYGRDEKRLEKLVAQQENTNCEILAGVLYPPVIAEIGNLKLLVRIRQDRCRIYKKDGELVVGVR